MRYATIYDAASFTAFLNLALVVPGILAIAAGVYVIRNPDGFIRTFPSSVFRWFFLLFGVLWTVIATVGVAADAARATYWARTGQCKVLEGVVQNFRPQQSGRHGSEAFTLEGVPFKYSGPIANAGFNTAGIIRQGLPVRLCYKAGEILRLEVAF